jgi:cyclophilin family peptidyl-prolyl cis-trans isomerase
VLELASGRQIVLELFAANAPDTVGNFVRLVRDRFYDGLAFHRVEDWVVQGGCPEGDGTGGPPWRIELEDSGHKSVRGAVGMALEPGSPNSAGSQFYILKADTPRLDEGVQRYCVFAQVVRGMDVVDHMAVGDAIATARIVSAAELPPESTGAPPGAGGRQ